MEERQINVQDDSLQPIENIVENTEGQMFTTSLIIAQAFEKEHFNVLQSIKNLECSKEFNALNFQAVEYKDAKGEMRPAYRITRDGFAFLAMGFTGKKAAAWKEKFLEAFNAMERALVNKAEESALPANEDESALSAQESVAEDSPKEVAPYFRPKRKISKNNVKAIHGLLYMEAYFQGISWQTAVERFCLREHVRSVERLPQMRFLMAVNESFRTLCYARKYSQQQENSVQIQDAMQGLMEFWHQMSSLSPQEIRNYVCHRCGIETIEELETKDNIMKALFVLWGGIANHTLRRKSC